MKYLLDTCLISELVKPKPNLGVVEWVNSISEQSCALSVLTFGELEKGISKLPPGKKRTSLEVWVYDDLAARFQGRTLPIDIDVSALWGKMGTAIVAIPPIITPIITQIIIIPTQDMGGLMNRNKTQADLEMRHTPLSSASPRTVAEIGLPILI